MEPQVTFAIAASIVLVTSVVDKLIQLWVPNSKINNMFDVVVTFVSKFIEPIANAGKK